MKYKTKTRQKNKKLILVFIILLELNILVLLVDKYYKHNLGTLGEISYQAERYTNDWFEKDIARSQVSIEVVKAEVARQAKEFGLPVDRVLSLAQCESGFKWNAKNPNSTARGVFQFLIATWEETESAKKGLERNNYKANIREAMIDLSNGEAWRWKECGY